MKTFETYSIRTLALLLGGLASGIALAGPGHDDAHHSAKATEAHWMAPEAEANRRNPVKADGASIARGKLVYQAQCASCHGAQGRGDGLAGKALSPKPADLATMAGQHPDGDFAWKIEHGRGPMPAWKAVLKPEQIWDTVNFIQSLAPRAAGGQGHADAPGHGKHQH